MLSLKMEYIVSIIKKSVELLEKKFSLEQASEGDVHTESIKIEKLLLQLVSERTGYPEEMLGLDQDMEAELGIDSIKRVEISASFSNESYCTQPLCYPSLACSITANSR